MASSSLAHTPSDRSLDDEWESWKKTFKKKYNSPDEESFRRALWEKTRLYIETHNKEYELGIHTFCLGLNEFGDMAPDETPCGCMRNKKKSSMKRC